MRKTGIIMHDIEEVLLDLLDGSNCGAAIEVTIEILEQYRKRSREFYIEEKRHPILKISRTKLDRNTRARLKRRMKPLVLELSKEHELQWGEILGLIHQYAQVHFETTAYKFSYSFSAPTR